VTTPGRRFAVERDSVTGRACCQASQAALQTDILEAIADRGYFNGEEIVACDQAGITVTMPKPMTSGAAQLANG
jgi:hypothetical protein